MNDKKLRGSSERIRLVRLLRSIVLTTVLVACAALPMAVTPQVASAYSEETLTRTAPYDFTCVTAQDRSVPSGHDSTGSTACTEVGQHSGLLAGVSSPCVVITYWLPSLYCRMVQTTQTGIFVQQPNWTDKITLSATIRNTTAGALTADLETCFWYGRDIRYRDIGCTTVPAYGEVKTMTAELSGRDFHPGRYRLAIYLVDREGAIQGPKGPTGVSVESISIRFSS